MTIIEALSEEYQPVYQVDDLDPISTEQEGFINVYNDEDENTNIDAVLIIDKEEHNKLMEEKSDNRIFLEQLPLSLARTVFNHDDRITQIIQSFGFANVTLEYGNLEVSEDRGKLIYKIQTKMITVD